MLKYRIRMRTRISYYEYRRDGGMHVDIELPEVESADELKKILHEIRGPVVTPPEVKEKEVERPMSIDVSTQAATYPSDLPIGIATKKEEQA